MTYYNLVKKTTNKKTGPIVVISSSTSTCPTACPFVKEGCYGKAVPYIKYHWDRFSRGEGRALSFDELINEIHKLPEGCLIRYGEVGDLPGDGTYINERHLVELIGAFECVDAKAWTYTHYLSFTNKEVFTRNCEVLMRNRSSKHFTINISEEDKGKALLMCDHFPTTMVIFDDGKKDWSKKKSFKIGNRKALICPAVSKEGIQCINCGGIGGPLCFNRKKNSPIICFPAHGSKRKAVNQLVESIG